MLYLVKNRDLSNFNVRDVRRTAALDEQRQHSAHISLPRVAITTGQGDNKGFYAAAKTMVPELRHSSPGVIVSTLKKALGLQEVANKHAARD